MHSGAAQHGWSSLGTHCLTCCRIPCIAAAPPGRSRLMVIGGLPPNTMPQPPATTQSEAEQSVWEVHHVFTIKNAMPWEPKTKERSAPAVSCSPRSASWYTTILPLFFLLCWCAETTISLRFCHCQRFSAIPPVHACTIHVKLGQWLLLDNYFTLRTVEMPSLSAFSPSASCWGCEGSPDASTFLASSVLNPGELVGSCFSSKIIRRATGARVCSVSAMGLCSYGCLSHVRPSLLSSGIRTPAISSPAKNWTASSYRVCSDSCQFRPHNSAGIYFLILFGGNNPARAEWENSEKRPSIAWLWASWSSIHRIDAYLQLSLLTSFTLISSY